MAGWVIPDGETPWDDKLREECGVYGVFGVEDASTYVALGLHALQHRGHEAAGIVSHTVDQGFHRVRRIGYVRDNFTKQSVMDLLPGPNAIGHTRQSVEGEKGRPARRGVPPLYADFVLGACASAQNGNLTD